MIKNIFRQTRLPVIEKILDVASVRQKTIASNVANVYTPGYRTKDVDFASSLEKAMNIQPPRMPASGNPRHIPVGRQSTPTSGDAVIHEGGTIDVEKEMAKSAENQLLYAAAAKIIGSRLRSIRACIRGRF